MEVAGGFSGKGVDEEVMEVARAVRGDIESYLGQPADRFDVEAARAQVVAGMNYHLKIRVSEGEWVHAQVYKPLPYTRQPPRLTGVVRGKNGSDPLD